MSGTNGKKRNSDDDDFDALRQYLLACPLVTNPSENAAVKAAIAGLDQELKRRARDAKLQKKFASASVSSAGAGTAGNGESLDDTDEWQAIERKQNSVDREGSPEGDEVFIDMEGDTSFLGKTLAEVAIVSIATSNARAKSPLAAIAAALHAAMRSDVLGFACTGSVNESSKGSAGGFAPPIRELPKSQFLPKNWESETSVVLRYRKNGTGSVLLKVEMAGQEISVKLEPANTKEPGEALVFPLQDHINLDSWNAALRASSGTTGLEPAIHYKELGFLMTKFSQRFDLGCINDNKPKTSAPPAAAPEDFIGLQVQSTKPRQDFAKPIYVGTGDPARGGYERPTIDGAFPQRPMFVGDFSGDLHGPLDPLRIGRTGPDSSGSLMGPNHPLFQGGGGIGGVGGASGFGMRPRFDPFGPPGGPQEVRPVGPDGRPLPPHMRPRGSGEPNADHLRPPNSLGGNMFS